MVSENADGTKINVTNVKSLMSTKSIKDSL